MLCRTSNSVINEETRITLLLRERRGVHGSTCPVPLSYTLMRHNLEGAHQGSSGPSLAAQAGETIPVRSDVMATMMSHEGSQGEAVRQAIHHSSKHYTASTDVITVIASVSNLYCYMHLFHCSYQYRIHINNEGKDWMLLNISMVRTRVK